MVQTTEVSEQTQGTWFYSVFKFYSLEAHKPSSTFFAYYWGVFLEFFVPYKFSKLKNKIH